VGGVQNTTLYICVVLPRLVYITIDKHIVALLLRGGLEQQRERWRLTASNGVRWSPFLCLWNDYEIL